MMNEMDHDLTPAIEAIASALRRSELAIAKFFPGTSQHSLLNHRITALKIALMLLSGEAEDRTPADIGGDDLRNAVPPLTSLLRKSEKARTKLAQGTWQGAMLDRQIAAIRTALPLLTKMLDQIDRRSA